VNALLLGRITGHPEVSAAGNPHALFSACTRHTKSAQEFPQRSVGRELEVVTGQLLYQGTTAVAP
jgi:hypothetical protein